MTGISKSFPGVRALENVDFHLRGGQVHALVGANGAGKSTLIKVLGGIVRPDAGEILIGGKRVEIESPVRARSLGISIIHQEYSLIKELNIAQNVFLGKELRSAGLFLQKSEMDRAVKEILGRFSLEVSPRTVVDRLSSGEQQMIEIIRSINSNAWVIVMDEPTSALSEVDKQRLFAFVNQLKNEGVAVVYITHHMPEIFRVAEMVTVLRDGKVVGTLPTRETNESEVVRMMVGKEATRSFTRGDQQASMTAMEVRGLTLHRAFREVGFSLQQGEILGFTGLRGSGCSEVVRCLFGFRQPDEGKVLIDGREVRIRSPREAIRRGLGFVPENRKEEGIVPQMSTSDNITLCSIDRISRLGWIGRGAERTMVQQSIADLTIKVASPGQLAAQLSGGNQQKVGLAKWLLMKPCILILNEPTRGIDVGAKSEIHALIGRLAREGIAIITVSYEVDEIAKICDRVLVFREGKVVEELARGEISEERILLDATGAAQRD